MSCIKGKSICEICENEFTWRRHESQNPASCCNNKCRSIQTSRRLKQRNESQFKYKNASEEEKFERFKHSFEEKVIKKDGCWDWSGYFDKNGYSQLSGFNGKNTIPLKAHRISYEIHKGKIPRGMFVCHSCDNPKCTNPDHLWLGTKKQNDQDKVDKNRSGKGINKDHFTIDEVSEIKKLLKIGVTSAHLSRKYKVSYTCIADIKNGKTWQHA